MASIADPASATVSSVLQALDSLYKTTDNAARNQANNWLQEFQKTVSLESSSTSYLDLEVSPLSLLLF